METSNNSNFCMQINSSSDSINVLNLILSPTIKQSSQQNRNDVCNGKAIEAKITTSGNLSPMTPQNYSPPNPIFPNLPVVDIPVPAPPQSLKPLSTSPPVIFIIGALGSIFLVIGYYQIVLKYCSYIDRLVNRRNNRRSRIRSADEGPNSNTGLDPSIIARIPVRLYNSKDADSGTECSVCLAEFSDGEAIRILPRCRHAFHIPCIGVWLHGQSTCPLCRADVAMDFCNLHSPHKDEQHRRPSPIIESHARSSSFRLNSISTLANANGDGNVRRARSLSRSEFPETELSNPQWYRRFVWSRRVTSPSLVRLYRGESSDHNGGNEPRSQEVVIDLGEPSHGGNAKPPVCNGG